MATERWIDKYELAERFGLVNAKGKPQTYTIQRKAATGVWPSRKVLGQLRFSPEDVAAIEELLLHPATAQKAQPAPAPTTRSRRDSAPKASGPSTKPTRTGGFADLEPRPIRDRRKTS